MHLFSKFLLILNTDAFALVRHILGLFNDPLIQPCYSVARSKNYCGENVMRTTDVSEAAIRRLTLKGCITACLHDAPGTLMLQTTLFKVMRAKVVNMALGKQAVARMHGSLFEYVKSINSQIVSLQSSLDVAFDYLRKITGWPILAAQTEERVDETVDVTCKMTLLHDCLTWFIESSSGISELERILCSCIQEQFLKTIAQRVCETILSGNGELSVHTFPRGDETILLREVYLKIFFHMLVMIVALYDPESVPSDSQDKKHFTSCGTQTETSEKQARIARIAREIGVLPDKAANTVPAAEIEAALQQCYEKHPRVVLDPFSGEKNVTAFFNKSTLNAHFGLQRAAAEDSASQLASGHDLSWFKPGCLLGHRF